MSVRGPPRIAAISPFKTDNRPENSTGGKNLAECSTVLEVCRPLNCPVTKNSNYMSGDSLYNERKASPDLRSVSVYLSVDDEVSNMCVCVRVCPCVFVCLLAAAVTQRGRQ